VQALDTAATSGISESQFHGPTRSLILTIHRRSGTVAWAVGASGEATRAGLGRDSDAGVDLPPPWTRPGSVSLKGLASQGNVGQIGWPDLFTAPLATLHQLSQSDRNSSAHRRAVGKIASTGPWRNRGGPISQSGDMQVSS
jgi:hypothetical protein